MEVGGQMTKTQLKKLARKWDDKKNRITKRLKSKKRNKVTKW